MSTVTCWSAGPQFVMAELCNYACRMFRGFFITFFLIIYQRDLHTMYNNSFFLFAMKLQLVYFIGCSVYFILEKIIYTQWF